MPTTLQIPSFAPSNIKERTSLSADHVSGTDLTVESTQGFSPDDIIYVGQLSREGCERADVASLTEQDTLTLNSALQTPHSRLDAVTSVVGDRIKIYRAANVNGSVPADGTFSELAIRTIDPDQLSTYYTDSSGSSAYWYRYTYYNPTTGVETSLLDSEPVRGDDFGHYASVSEIRHEAGFDGSVNLSDNAVDAQRRIAEAEINSTLRSAYTVPFVKPPPQRIRYLTIQLAAGLLMNWAYPGQGLGDSKIKDARAQLISLQSGDVVLDDDTVTPYDGSGVSSWPNDSTPSRAERMHHHDEFCDHDHVSYGGDGRAFTTEDVY